MTLHVQFLTMIFMVLSGLYLGMALETFRRFSPLWKNKRILIYLLEIFFWLVQTLLIFYVLYRVNAGELRLYIFIACLLGFAIYQALLTTLYKRLLEQIIIFITAVLRLVKGIVQTLILSPIGWGIRILMRTILFILTTLYVLVKIALLPVKWIFQCILYLLPIKKIKLFHKLEGFYSIIKNRLIKWVNTIKGR